MDLGEAEVPGFGEVIRACGGVGGRVGGVRVWRVLQGGVFGIGGEGCAGEVV